MIAKTILGLLLVVMACSGSSQKWKSGLLIDNGINRGISYNDSLGSDFNLRYIPITISNDTTIPIHLQIAFSKEYAYPIPEGEEKFRLIPLPKAWALERVDITEKMLDKLADYIDQPTVTKSLEAGEKYVIAIGTLYPRPPKTSGILPKTLFTQLDKEVFPSCEWQMEKDPSSNQQIALGLKLNFGGNCMVVPCGHIFYPEP